MPFKGPFLVNRITSHSPCSETMFFTNVEQLLDRG